MRGKRDSPKRPTGLCKRDIKISLQIASTTFPFRSRSTYRIETRERLTALVPSRFYMRFAVVSLTRSSRGERFFCNRCAFTTTDRFDCREHCLSRYCNDPQEFFAGLRRDVYR